MANTTTASSKHSCSACGGEADWNPQKQALVCPYCGHSALAEMEVMADGSQVVLEHDLLQALRELPADAVGWKAEKTSVRCQSCQAISVFSPENVSQACDFCGATALVPETEQGQPYRPESVIPMRVSETQVRESIRKWYGSHFFAPSRLGRSAMTDRVHGLYVPYWTFDAQARSAWSAESGTYYWEKRTQNGKTESVQRTRWTPASGRVSHAFDDEQVAAGQGVHAKLLSQVEPFDTKALEVYDPKFLSGWVVERYQVDLAQAAERARESMNSHMRSLCSRDVPGDTQRGLRVDTKYTGQTFKHVLFPLWLLTYRYGGKDYQVVINGQSGAIGGEYPLSWFKITLTVLLGLTMIALFFWLRG